MALVMFDYDGVIVDSLAQFTNNFIRACRENGFLGLKSQEDALALFDGNVYETLARFGVDAVTINKILVRYEELAKGYLDKIRLFPGMGQALERIAEQNTIYIITSNISSVPVKVLGKHGISCFKEVLGAEKEKSKIKKIQSTIKKHPELPAFYVGDTRGDIIEGREGGASTVGVAWGWHGAQKLKEVFPDYLVETPEELAELLSEKSKQSEE
ncbi:haloacid dehalogenase domain-containing protein hydrolase [Thermincola ferriacetica]|uniref:Haloacid dehalogenase domain-containing protein hydrolase n=1 Tax=Thermincola ferriacetica TaxID=281456 RepID=A0A0L6W042_9FIRM|nr:HAD hydrolase-like protein [Thermincola ferriacetica]KNZ68783.1 haloacid dehalogenase domain-containing protein hydrolase [Thermincola ferriacetica]